MSSTKRGAYEPNLGTKRQRMISEKAEMKRLLNLAIDWKPFLQTIPETEPALFEEYKRFLILKTLQRDICVEKLKLSPSAPVDDVWHNHLLLPRHYADACSALLNEPHAIFEHSTLTAQEERRDERYSTTLKLYEQYWGKPDAKYWPTERKTLHIFVRGIMGELLSVHVKPSDKAAVIFDQCVKKWVGIGEPRLIFSGKLIYPNKTISEQGIRHESTIHQVLALRGC